jgi:hypothetical protein
MCIGVELIYTNALPKKITDVTPFPLRIAKNKTKQTTYHDFLFNFFLMTKNHSKTGPLRISTHVR